MRGEDEDEEEEADAEERAAARSHLLAEERDPVGGREPLVAFDVLHAVLQVAVAFGEIDLQQVLQEVLQVGREVRRKSHLYAHTYSTRTGIHVQYEQRCVVLVGGAERRKELHVR